MGATRSTGRRSSNWTSGTSSTGACGLTCASFAAPSRGSYSAPAFPGKVMRPCRSSKARTRPADQMRRCSIDRDLVDLESIVCARRAAEDSDFEVDDPGQVDRRRLGIAGVGQVGRYANPVARCRVVEDPLAVVQVVVIDEEIVACDRLHVLEIKTDEGLS